MNEAARPALARWRPRLTRQRSQQAQVAHLGRNNNGQPFAADRCALDELSRQANAIQPPFRFVGSCWKLLRTIKLKQTVDGRSKNHGDRYAEKPITGRAAGVRARGDEDDVSLITRGCMCSPSDSTWVWRAVNAAVNLMEGLRSRHAPAMALSAVAEQLLPDAGRIDEAYARYGIQATSANTNIAIFRAIAKRYPGIEPNRVLGDLIASTPGEEGKWFATAKTLKQYDLALALERRAPVDPKTLVRAARDHAVAATGTLGPGTHVSERVACNVAGDGPAARWLRQCSGLDTDP